MKKDSFNTLWQTYHTRLLRFIQSRVSSREIADDLVQDVFLKAYEHLDQVQLPEKTESWLFQIARHRIADHYRMRKMALPLDDFTDQLAVIDHASNAPMDLFHKVIDAPQKDQLSSCIRRSVKNLPQPYQQALQITGVEGKTQQQFASATSLSLSAAKSRVQRGRKLLKNILQQCCHFELSVSQQVDDFWQKPFSESNDCCSLVS